MVTHLINSLYCLSCFLCEIYPVHNHIMLSLFKNERKRMQRNQNFINFAMLNLTLVNINK